MVELYADPRFAISSGRREAIFFEAGTDRFHWHLSASKPINVRCFPFLPPTGERSELPDYLTKPLKALSS